MLARSKVKRLFSVAMAIMLLYILFYSYEGLSKETLAVIGVAEWEFLAIGAAFQVACVCSYALLCKRCFKVYKIDWKFLDFLMLYLTSIFASLISFVGGAIAGGLFLQKAKKENALAVSVINALFLVNLADFAVLFIFLIVGIFFLFVEHDITGYEIVGFAAFTLLILGIAFVLVAGNFRPGLLVKFFRLVRGLANTGAKIFRSKFSLAESWPREKCAEFAGVSKQLTKNKTALAKLAAVSFLVHITNALTLFFCFFAFGYQAGWEVVISGYGMGMLFSTVSITPQGLGVVDAIMMAVFVSFGATLKIAVLAVFAFRLLSFWLPALVGFFTFNKLTKAFNVAD